jgi:mRNA interferase RelE/StbE
MTVYSVRFTREAARLLSTLHLDNKKMIKSVLQDLKEDPYLGDELQEQLARYRSLKPKRYRIIYTVNDDKRLINILYVGHRRDVYENFRLFLHKMSE